MAGINATCTYCGERFVFDPADRDSGYRRMAGWGHRGVNGGSDIECREWTTPPEFACWRCVSKLKDGLAPGQGTLI